MQPAFKEIAPISDTRYLASQWQKRKFRSLANEEGSMNEITGYTMTARKVHIGNKEIIERNFHPIFINEDARKNAKQRIERGLYKVFSKYCEKST